MIARRKLHHVAAGLLGNFISRNSDYQGDWALGVLYTEAHAAGMRMELDLLHGRALPEAPASASVARGYAAFLLAAFARHGVTLDKLSSARLVLVFGLPGMPAGESRFGDRVDCSLTIASHEGKTVTRQVSSQCAPHDSRVFRRAKAMREAAYMLHRHVVQRSRDCDSRWSLDVLREACPEAQSLGFDLLRGSALPPHPLGDAVARGYAGQLRRLLGEWMSDLGTAEIRLRFSRFPRFPGVAVFAESRLGTHDGYAVSHNGGADTLPEAPRQATP